MTFVKFRPLATRNASVVNNLFDSVWQHSLNQVVGTDNWHSQPGVNIIEDEHQFSLALAAPGFPKEAFKLNIEGQTLTISAEQAPATLPEGTRFLRREFQYSTFRRAFSLPENVSVENIAAQYDNGILTITVPKAAPVKVVKHIEVQ